MFPGRCNMLMEFKVVKLFSLNSKHVNKYFSTSSLNRHKERSNFDIVISGGGMIGTALACALSQQTILNNHRILLIEGAEPKMFSLKQQYSNRVSSLSPSSKEMFDSLGVWEKVRQLRFKPVAALKVWGSVSKHMVEFSRTAAKDVAYVVENDVLVAALLEILNESCNVSIMNGKRITKYEINTKTSAENPKLVTATLDDNTSLQCDLLVGADGPNSTIRSCMGSQYLSWDYSQMAIVATLQLVEAYENSVAWQRFLPTGPVALLPLDDCFSSLVWSTSREEAKCLLQLPSDSFADALNSAFLGPSKNIEAVNVLNSVLLKTGLISAEETSICPPLVQSVAEASRAAFPLSFGHSTNYVSPGVVLIGDAAHKVHPLAGQGVNLGFGDIRCLVQVLTTAVQNGKKINDLISLRQYESAQQKNNLPTMIAIDLMNKVYSSDSTAAMVVNNLCLQLASSWTPIKKMMMNQASS